MEVEPVNPRQWVDDHWGAPQLGLRPTQRELEVFLVVIQLGGQQPAAAALGISVQTVKNHMTSIYARLGVHNQMGALWVLYGTLAAMARERRSGADRRQPGDRRSPQHRPRLPKDMK